MPARFGTRLALWLATSAILQLEINDNANTHDDITFDNAHMDWVTPCFQVDSSKLREL